MTDETKPIDMVLHCPACGMQHIDKPEGQFIPGFTAEETVAHNKHFGLWHNPPHRSHLCHGCGHIWRPADVPTNGVAAVKTKGKADSPIAQSRDQIVPATDNDLTATDALLREALDLCKVGDIDEHTDDGIGWGAWVREVNTYLRNRS